MTRRDGRALRLMWLRDYLYRYGRAQTCSIAQALRVDRRTISRDITVLMGYPFYTPLVYDEDTQEWVWAGINERPGAPLPRLLQ